MQGFLDKKGLKILFLCIAGNYENPSVDTYYTGWWPMKYTECKEA